MKQGRGGINVIEKQKTNKKITAMTSQAQETCIATTDLLFSFFVFHRDKFPYAKHAVAGE